MDEGTHENHRRDHAEDGREKRWQGLLHYFVNRVPSVRVVNHTVPCGDLRKPALGVLSHDRTPGLGLLV